MPEVVASAGKRNPVVGVAMGVGEGVKREMVPKGKRLGDKGQAQKPKSNWL